MVSSLSHILSVQVLDISSSNIVLPNEVETDKHVHMCSVSMHASQNHVQQKNVWIHGQSRHVHQEETTRVYLPQWSWKPLHSIQ